MKKLHLYLDTSVLNFFFEENDVEKRDSTKKLFDQLDIFEVYISELVLQEIDRCHEPKRTALLQLVQKHKPLLLPFNDEIEHMGKLYVDDGIIPSKYYVDAVHIAFATVYEVDALVSWNLEHMVKLRTKRMVSYINLREGYKTIDILTPQEIIE